MTKDNNRYLRALHWGNERHHACVNVCIHDFDDAKEESNKVASKDKHLLQD